MDAVTLDSAIEELRDAIAKSNVDVSEILRGVDAETRAAVRYCWPLFRRQNQTPPSGDWSTWLLLAGRGFGKTRVLSEYTIDAVRAGQATRVAVAGRTSADVRDVLVEGESGILACSPPWFQPHYEPSKRRLTWPNGAVATTFTADKPDQARGPQHDLLICDELASWRRPEAWDMLRMGLRLGNSPRAIVATTPRQTKAMRDLIADVSTVVTRGTTYDNRANLAGSFFRAIIAKYEGTRLGRQELMAELLEDVAGALWTHAVIEETRVNAVDRESLTRVVVSIDPAVTSHDESDETGIIISARGQHGRGYVLNDMSGRYAPAEWARAAIRAYRANKADVIVAEVNQGGEMVGHTLRMEWPDVPFRALHASRGKLTRAEPISMLYEQGRVSHVGCYPELEDQMCTYVPGEKSPDRMDALVWGLTELYGSEDMLALDVGTDDLIRGRDVMVV